MQGEGERPASSTRRAGSARLVGSRQLVGVVEVAADGHHLVGHNDNYTQVSGSRSSNTRATPPIAHLLL